MDNPLFNKFVSEIILMITSTENFLYCNSLTRYERLLTREVFIGDVPMGANNPIRVQSMTTTDTMNTIATVEQSIRMIEAGCEYVRITAPSINEAKNLENIKKELRLRGYKTPLIADIHFTPNAAEVAARIVEKVRVNPGNFADKKKFENIEYNDGEYDAEIERIRNRFVPLVRICKEYGTAMRIGTNHGSLSDRIMSRYGDTPLGMVESALEFLRICEDENYYNIVLSMKSSNPQVMVQAYRLLINKMKESGMNYPLHLGVTEAGDGEDGRIKSAAGIGTLLEDGIGDTIRVSLTEDPEFEIPVAKRLVERYIKRTGHSSIPEFENQKMENGKWKFGYSPFEYRRRETKTILNFGGHNVPRVIADFSNLTPGPRLASPSFGVTSPDGGGRITPANLFSVGYNYSKQLDKWNITDQACDYIFAGDTIIDFEIPGTLGVIYNHKTWAQFSTKTRCYPLFTAEEFFVSENKSSELNFVVVTIENLFRISDPDSYRDGFRTSQHNVVLVFETTNEHGMAEQRRMFFELIEKNISVPVIIKRNYENESLEKFQLYSSTDCGALFIDGFGDGIWLTSPQPSPKERGSEISPAFINSTAFGILQATRQRISKTEYISCPSCGRTLFDLQETTQKIRSRTAHLKGLKIAIMGCIVNGPGEMADADYGYVGSGPGKITLYKGKEVVKRNVETPQAVDALIDLIKQNGDWVEREDVVI
jgi:(E)-4-hydroxy-3-methylbut-2-enyl-diphosphate synthase